MITALIILSVANLLASFVVLAGVLSIEKNMQAIAILFDKISKAGIEMLK